MRSTEAGKRQTARAERSVPISCPSLLASLVLKPKFTFPSWLCPARAALYPGMGLGWRGFVPVALWVPLCSQIGAEKVTWGQAARTSPAVSQKETLGVTKGCGWWSPSLRQGECEGISGEQKAPGAWR